MAFLALSEVTPVTHAVGNTIKRVVIIIASVFVFRNPLSQMGAIGSIVAIAGSVPCPIHSHIHIHSPFSHSQIYLLLCFLCPRFNSNVFISLLQKIYIYICTFIFSSSLSQYSALFPCKEHLCIKGYTLVESSGVRD